MGRFSLLYSSAIQNSYQTRHLLHYCLLRDRLECPYFSCVHGFANICSIQSFEGWWCKHAQEASEVKGALASSQRKLCQYQDHQAFWLGAELCWQSWQSFPRGAFDWWWSPVPAKGIRLYRKCNVVFCEYRNLHSLHVAWQYSNNQQGHYYWADATKNQGRSSYSGPNDGVLQPTINWYDSLTRVLPSPWSLERHHKS